MKFDKNQNFIILEDETWGLSREFSYTREQRDFSNKMIRKMLDEVSKHKVGSDLEQEVTIDE